jgi:hypothetical protein
MGREGGVESGRVRGGKLGRRGGGKAKKEEE